MPSGHVTYDPDNVALQAEQRDALFSDVLEWHLRKRSLSKTRTHNHARRCSFRLSRGVHAGDDGADAYVLPANQRRAGVSFGGTGASTSRSLGSNMISFISATRPITRGA